MAGWGEIGLESKLALLVLCGVLYALFTLCLSKWRHYEKVGKMKLHLGCQDPPKYPHKDRLWGSDMARLRAEATKEGRFFRLYLSQFETYGKTFEEIWQGQRLINTIEPANIKQITTLAFNDYCKDPGRSKAQFPLLGPSIFSNGPVWKPSRALVTPIFRRAELSDMDHLASFTDQFMKLIPCDGSTIDMQPLLLRLFVDVSTDFIFGKSLNSLQSETPAESVEFIEAFEKANKGVTRRIEAIWLRYHDFVDKDWTKAYKTVHRFVDKQDERALKENETDTEPNKETSAQRRRYVLLDEMAKQIRDPIQLRYQVLGAFLPARDTTATTVGNILFQLARHSAIWAKLRRISLGLVGRPLTLTTIQSLDGFRHVVLETVRLVGPAARVWRVADADTILPTGGGPDRKSLIFVPKGTKVVMGTWSIQHDRDLWGNDVEEFRPDRWIGRRFQWDFLPWLAGPRRCPAQQQVMTYAIYILIQLTQRFKTMENRDPVFEYIEQFSMGFASRNGVMVAFNEA